jgi:hypothetical protein
MPIVGLVPILFPSSRIEPPHLFIGFGIWFFCWVAFGSRRDVCFWIHTRDGKDIVRVVGQTGQWKQLQTFVRHVRGFVSHFSKCETYKLLVTRPNGLDCHLHSLTLTKIRP